MKINVTKSLLKATVMKAYGGDGVIAPCNVVELD
jgi:hypothetical protein